jgi:2-hydroxy-3-keto-5-methylthiopentenyl-1-phosphate phosphatase
MQKIVVFCDYDGTIIENDACDLLMERFSSPNWEEPGKKYLANQISHSEMNEAFARNIVATKGQLIDLVKSKIIIRDGFQEFYSKLQSLNATLVVISGGWELYISELLSEISFKYIESIDILVDHIISGKSEVSLVTNRLVNSFSESNWEILTPWGEHSCQKSTPCKGIILDAIKKLGYYTIAIGNSETDICMAEKADYVFATGSLPNQLRQRSIKHYPFTSFNQVSKGLQSLIKLKSS